MTCSARLWKEVERFGCLEATGLCGLNVTVTSVASTDSYIKCRNSPKVHVMKPIGDKTELIVPHSHAYLDLNNDFMSDLFVTTVDHFEVWHGIEKEGFEFSHKIHLPDGNYKQHVGQTLFLDVELKGEMNYLLPVCFDNKCTNSSILVNHGQSFENLNVNFKDNENQQWGFVVPDKDQPYLNTITMRAGDFNMDGFP